MVDGDNKVVVEDDKVVVDGDSITLVEEEER